MRALLTLLSLPLAACATEAIDQPLNVKQVVENARALDGREVLVRGWIQQCAALSCALYASEEEAGAESPYVLSVGRRAWFDRAAARRAPGWVTFRAKVDDECVSDPSSQLIAVCTDRPDSLKPISPPR